METGYESMETAENKVFILYFMKKIHMAVGNIQFIKIMLENRYMNYFYLQQYLSELIEEKLLSTWRQEGQQFYEINDKGLEVLSMFENILPLGLKKRVDQSVTPIRRSIRMETLITADYAPEGEDGYNVFCKIKEDDFPLIEIKIAVGSKDDARNMCKNWSGFPQEIYLEILETLLKDRKKDETNALPSFEG
jgi:predicted transcriptional regulator